MLKDDCVRKDFNLLSCVLVYTELCPQNTQLLVTHSSLHVRYILEKGKERRNKRHEQR
jgi:hypothetical protein